jgi:hypothetical protein
LPGNSHCHSPEDRVNLVKCAKDKAVNSCHAIGLFVNLVILAPPLSKMSADKSAKPCQYVAQS